MSIAPEIQDQLLAHQRNEITEYHIYSNLAKASSLQKISKFWKKLPMKNSAITTFLKSTPKKM